MQGPDIRYPNLRIGYDPGCLFIYPRRCLPVHGLEFPVLLCYHVG